MNKYLTQNSSTQEKCVYIHLKHNVFQQLPTEQLLCTRDTAR